MSLYTTGRDDRYFPDPDSFRPERWLRDSETRMHGVQEPHAFIPFGVGVRSCIGRRVAEMQMQFLLTRVRRRDLTLNHSDLESLPPHQVVQNFRLTPATDKDVAIKLRMITAPEEPIQLRLQSRHT